MLGIGLAATRDRRRSSATPPRTNGTANPSRASSTLTVALGTSQSGNFIKTFVHLGFNEDRRAQRVWDGILPYIAGRQTPMNVRFAAPGGAGTPTKRQRTGAVVDGHPRD